jgi:hypothetical protein
LGLVDLIERVKLGYPDEKRTSSLRKRLKKLLHTIGQSD